LAEVDEKMLWVKNLDVYYDKTEAIKNVTIRIESGQVVALLGSNGAGKTTTISAISGFVAPSAGEILYREKSIRGKKPHGIVKAGIVQVSQDRDLFPDLTVLENLRLGGALKKERGKVSQALDSVFQNFPRLRERREQRAGTLSGGEQQMLAIGRAMMSEPSLLLLDEPTTGLAPLFVKRIAELLTRLKGQGTTMLVVEQNAPVAVSLAHYFYVLRNGKILAEGKTDTLPPNVNEFFAKYYIQ
jgi:branched-chain amino acid transport system ATP-binding protein